MDRSVSTIDVRLPIYDFILFYADENEDEAKALFERLQNLGLKGCSYNDPNLISLSTDEYKRTELAAQNSLYMFAYLTDEFFARGGFIEQHRSEMLAKTVVDPDKRNTVIPILNKPKSQYRDMAWGFNALTGVNCNDRYFDSNIVNLLNSDTAKHRRALKEEHRRALKEEQRRALKEEQLRVAPHESLCEDTRAISMGTDGTQPRTADRQINYDTYAHGARLPASGSRTQQSSPVTYNINVMAGSNIIQIGNGNVVSSSAPSKPTADSDTADETMAKEAASLSSDVETAAAADDGHPGNALLSSLPADDAAAIPDVFPSPLLFTADLGTCAGVPDAHPYSTNGCMSSSIWPESAASQSDNDHCFDDTGKPGDLAQFEFGNTEPGLLDTASSSEVLGTGVPAEVVDSSGGITGYSMPHNSCLLSSRPAAPVDSAASAMIDEHCATSYNAGAAALLDCGAAAVRADVSERVLEEVTDDASGRFLGHSSPSAAHFSLSPGSLQSRPNLVAVVNPVRRTEAYDSVERPELVSVDCTRSPTQADTRTGLTGQLASVPSMDGLGSTCTLPLTLLQPQVTRERMMARRICYKGPENEGTEV